MQLQHIVGGFSGTVKIKKVLHLQCEQHRSHEIGSFQIRCGPLSYPSILYKHLSCIQAHRVPAMDFCSGSTFVINVRSWESQTKTNIMIKSGAYHPDVLDEICFTEDLHITVAPLLAPTLYPHAPLLCADVAAVASQRAIT